jgi:MerR family transcriptional regulator/heat shock protein HspR
MGGGGKQAGDNLGSVEGSGCILHSCWCDAVVSGADRITRHGIFGAGEDAVATKRKTRGAYMISAVAEMYEIHPQTLRLYEREGLLRPSRSDGNTRLYTDEDLERLEFILNLARDLGVNIAGIAIVLQMRERMEEMNRQMQGFVDYVRTEMLTHMQQQAPSAGLVPMRRPMIVPVKPAAKTVKKKL